MHEQILFAPSRSQRTNEWGKRPPILVLAGLGRQTFSRPQPNFGNIVLSDRSLLTHQTESWLPMIRSASRWNNFSFYKYGDILRKGMKWLANSTESRKDASSGWCYRYCSLFSAGPDGFRCSMDEHSFKWMTVKLMLKPRIHPARRIFDSSTSFYVS